MDVLGDLVGRERRRKEPLVHSAASQPYTAHKFCTDAWKTASLFRYHGVGPGATVAIADDAKPQPLLALFGTALLGAQAEFGSSGDLAVDGPRVLVGDASTLEELAPPPGTKRVGYDGPPEDPDVIHFERDVWSENPTMPPDTVAPDEPVLRAESEVFSHANLLAHAERVVDEIDLSEGERVAVEASLRMPGTVVAGVLAPLSVGAELLLPGASTDPTVVVTTEATSDGTVNVDPRRVLDGN